MASLLLRRIRPLNGISVLAPALRTSGLLSKTKSLPVAAILSQRNASETFIEKNKRLGRPTSPHILIYKFELPGLLSGSHRATGIIQSGIISLAAVGLMIAPENLEYYVNYIQAMDLPRPVLGFGKMLFAWPFVYHLFNGTRHLAWDVTAKGLSIGAMYKTGYVIFFSSLLTTAGLVWAF